MAQHYIHRAKAPTPLSPALACTMFPYTTAFLPIGRSKTVRFTGRRYRITRVSGQEETSHPRDFRVQEVY